MGHTAERYKRQKVIESIAAGIRDVKSVLDDLDEHFRAISSVCGVYVSKTSAYYVTHNHLCFAYSRLMDIEYKVLTYMAAYVDSMSAENQENTGCEDKREKRGARRRTRDRIKRIKSDMRSLNERLSASHGAIFDETLTPEEIIDEIKKALLDIETTHHKVIKFVIECMSRDLKEDVRLPKQKVSCGDSDGGQQKS